jgi:CzcA family heavy metal efflux pump
MNREHHGLLAATVRFSLRYPGVIIALACAFLGYGIYTLFQARSDVFPEFAAPQVVIQTEAPGLSPEQVELLVTQPVENAINGLPGIERLASSSIQGMSLITATFAARIDVFRARQSVAEQLATIGESLPAGVRAPAMTPLTSSTSTVLVAGITSRHRSLLDLRTMADWLVKPRLLAVPGVAKVAIFGGDVRQLQIQVDPARLIAFDCSLNDVVEAARGATGVRGAGFIDTRNQRIVLEAEGQSVTPGELAAAVLTYHDGIPVRFGDIGRVVDAPEPPVGAASIMGEPGVMLIVSEQYEADTLDVSRRLKEALDGLRPTLEAERVELHPDLFRPADFIDTALRNVRTSLLIGGILVALILTLFFLNVRTAAISCTAIPLSLVGSATILHYCGISLNTMTLGGLAIAIGEVVDDAIIDVENIVRRLSENRRRENPASPFRVVLDASLEVRSAVTFATFSVILVFAPIVTVTGVAGRIFAPLGFAYMFAIVTSLLVALTVTPALCLILVGKRGHVEHAAPAVRWLRKHYHALLLRVERHPRSILLAVAVVVLGGVAALPFFGGEFLPELREGHFIVHMAAVPGTSLEESLALGREVTLEMLKLPFVRSVAQRVGRAEKSDDILGTHYNEFEVDLKPLAGEEAERAQAALRALLTRFVGVSFAVNTFLTERVEETLSGYTAPVVLTIFGNDLDALDRTARDVKRALGAIPGASDVQIQAPAGTPQLVVRLRPGDVSREGLRAVDVLEAVRTAYEGAIVAQIYEGNRVFAVSVILDPAVRGNVAAVGDLPLRNAEGRHIFLRDVADIIQSSGRYAVLHDGARRVQTLTSNVVGRDLTSFVEEARRKLTADVTLPPETYLAFSGAAAEHARFTQDLLVRSLLAGLGILLLLAIAFGNARNLLLVLPNLPFALVGGVIAVFASGANLSLGSLVGFVTIFGITLRNSIMLISHFKHLVEFEGMSWGLETAVRGATERVVPILMTASVTTLGLLPLALGSGDPGREIEGPMALVILGGLATSTLLNLLVVPTLAARYGKFETQKNDE